MGRGSSKVGGSGGGAAVASGINLESIPNGKDKGKYEITKTDRLGRKLYFSGMKNGSPVWVTDYSRAKRVTKATAQKYKNSFG